MSWFDDIGDWVEDRADDIADAAGDAVGAVEDAYQQAQSWFEEHGTWLTDHWDDFDFPSGLDSIPGNLADALSYGADFVEDMSDALVDPSLYAGLTEGVFGAVDILEGPGRDAAEALNGAVNAYFGAFGTAIEGARNAASSLKDTFERLMNSTSDFVYQYSRVLSNAVAESVMPGGSWLIEKMWSVAAEQSDFFSNTALGGFFDNMSKANFLPAFDRMVYQVFDAVADTAKSGALTIAAEAYGATRSVQNAWADGQFERLGEALRAPMEAAFRTVLGGVEGQLPALVDAVDNLGRQTKALVVDTVATNMSPSQLMLLSRMGITELQSAVGVLIVTAESALAAAVGGVRLAADTSVIAVVKGGAIAQLGAGAIESMAKAGVTAIAGGAQGAAFGLATLDAIVDNGMDLQAGAYDLVDDGVTLATLTAEKVATLGGTGLDSVTAVGEWTMDAATAAALAAAGIAVSGSDLVRVTVSDTLTSALPLGEIVVVITAPVWAPASEVAAIVQRGVADAVSVVIAEGGSLVVMLDPSALVQSFGTLIDEVGELGITFIDAAGSYGLAAADSMETLGRSVADYAAKGVHRVYADIGSTVLDADLVAGLIEHGSRLVATGAGQLVTVLVNDELLANVDFAGWAAAGVQGLHLALDTTTVALNRAVAAGAAGLSFIGEGAITVIDSANALATLSVEQIAALTTAGVDTVVAARNATIGFVEAQAFALADIAVTVSNNAAIYIDIAGNALDHARPEELERLIDHGMRYVVAEGVTYALMVNDQVKDLTGEDLAELAFHAGRIYLTRGEIGLALAVLEKIAEYDTPISGPLGTVVKVLDSAAIITSITKGTLYKLAAVGVTALVANEGLPTIDLGFGFNLADLSMKLLASDKIVRLADNVLKLADVDAGDISRLAEAGVTAVVATGGDLMLGSAQVAGYVANGVTVALDAGRHGVIDAGTGVTAAIAAAAGAPWIDVIRVGGDAVVDLASAAALAASSVAIDLADGVSLLVEAGAAAFGALDPAALKALVDKGLSLIDVDGTLVALIGETPDAAALGALAEAGIDQLKLLGGEAHGYTITVTDALVAVGDTLRVNAVSLAVGEALAFDGSAEQDGRFVINGGAAADRMTAGGQDDILSGNAGDDTLNGGAGRDRMIGGAGRDTFYVQDARDFVIEAADEGMDTVYASVSYSLRAGQAVERLWADPDGNLLGITLAGNALAQEIRGDAGTNRILGNGGADTLAGLAGDDTYVVTDAAATVVEQSGDGYDTVVTSVSYTLADNVEAIRTGDAGGTAAIDLTGNGGDNALVGNAGDNVLDGRGGADVMAGGLGNDTYHVDSVADRVVDRGGSSDTVVAAIDYTLPGTIERLELSLGGLTGRGNGLANIMVGSAGDDVLAGRQGLDMLTGGEGADQFLFETGARAADADTISDFAAGVDRIALDDRAFRQIGSPGTLDARFFTDGPATTRDHHILYDAATGTLAFDADGSGIAHAAVVFATVAPGTIVTAADIIVV